jgi:hypothetical protein
VPIHTINDLRDASEHDVREALKQVTVKDDLFSFLRWLHSQEGGQIEGRFSLGYHPRGRGLHPSQITKDGVCLYKMYLDCVEEVESIRKFDYDMQLIFDHGTLAHSMLQTYFLHMYEGQFEEEVWLKRKKLLITSHADGRFTFSNVRFILEIKSIKEGGSFGFAKVQDRPFKENVRQLMTYMALDNCPFGLLFYFCKNTGQIKEHPIVYNDEVWQDLKQRVVLPVVAAVESGEHPQATPGYHCKKCEYFHGCKYGKGHANDARGQRRSGIRGSGHPVFRRQ